MRRAGPLLLAAALAACAAPPPQAPAGPAPAAAQTPPAAGPVNFELSAYEVVESAEADTLEYVQVYRAGQLLGRTETAAKSRPKLWRGELPEGNWPMRFEVWDSSDGVSGLRRPDEAQPRERFMRVEPGQRLGVVLKLFDQGRQYLYAITREPAGKD